MNIRMNVLNKLIVFLLTFNVCIFEFSFARPFEVETLLLPTKNLYISYIWGWTIFLCIGILIYLNFRNNKRKKFKIISLIMIILVLISIIGLIILSIQAIKNKYFYYSIGGITTEHIIGKSTLTFFISNFIIAFNIILIALLGEKSNIKRVILAIILPFFSMLYFFILFFLYLNIGGFENNINWGDLIYFICVLINFMNVIVGPDLYLKKVKMKKLIE